MSTSANTLNPFELAISQTPPSQYVKAPAPGPLNALGGGLGGIAAATPWGAAAGLLGAAINTPDPNMTANVTANPANKYGDRYMENTVGASKNGSFVVQSGKSDSNLQNRQDDQPLPMTKTLWLYVALGGVLLIGVFVWLRR